MYNDRLPYNQPRFFPPVIKWLLILNVGIFILGQLPIGMNPDGTTQLLEQLFVYHGGLWPPGSLLFRPWQYLTTMFLHASLMHVGLNMFVLWMFGLELENMWGSKRFIVFYLLSGIGAGILHSIVTLLAGDTIPAVGASGAISGVMIAFAMLFPNRMIILFFFLPMKAKWAAVLYIGLELINGVFNNGGDNIAHFAHLGGALAGYILLKTGLHTTIANKFLRNTSNDRLYHVQPPAPSGPVSRADRRQSATIIDARFRDIPPSSPRNAPVNMDFGEHQEEIDQILDKISAYGYQSLTQEEKDMLNQASKQTKN